MFFKIAGFKTANANSKACYDRSSTQTNTRHGWPAKQHQGLVKLFDL